MTAIATRRARIGHGLWKRRRLVPPLLAIFCAVFGSKLWLVATFGSDVPFWDQWNGEGQLLYKPLLEHGAGAVQWLAAHNEHRILLARLTSTLLFYVNGQWDPLVQMCWEAVCAGLIAALLCAVARRLLPADRPVALLWVVIVLGTAVPYGWENSLAGFQTPFYYLVLIAIGSFYLCASAAPITRRRSVAILGLGLLSLVTLASGALVCLATCGGLLVRFRYAREPGRRRLLAVIVGLAVLAVAGFMTTPTIPYHESLRAHGIAMAWKAFRSVMGWPLGIGLAGWIPFALLTIRAARRRELASPEHLFVTALALFTILNAAAIATARAASTHGPDLDSRYTDIAWLAWLVNLWAAALLVRSSRTGRSGSLRRVALVCWFLFASAALLIGGRRAIDGAVNRGNIYAIESASTRDYVATGNRDALASQPFLHIPYPDAAALATFIDDPTLRAILPPGIRPRLLQRARVGQDALHADGFVRPGVPVTTPPAPDNELFFGSFAGNGNDDTARFVSPVVEAQGRILRLRVAGYPGKPGLALYLEDATTGRRVDIVPRETPGDAWVVVSVRIPGPRYRLVAEDSARGNEAWLAFTDPVEVGSLRPLAERLIRSGSTLTVFGLLLLIALMLVFPPRIKEKAFSR